VEITLDHQGAERLDAFEQRVSIADAAVQQCYRVSPGPDFLLVVHTPDMPGYLALAQRLFNADANVRNVKAFFQRETCQVRPKTGHSRRETVIICFIKHSFQAILAGHQMPLARAGRPLPGLSAFA
jgi:DNA-binding Lrp family transcriptional regulator